MTHNIKKKQKSLASLANPNAALISAIENNKSDRIKSLLEEPRTDINHDKNKPLRTAVKKGNLRTVRDLVDAGASLDNDAMSEILSEALKREPKDIWQYFTSNNQIDFKKYGSLAFCDAVEQGNYQEMAFLIAKGIDLKKCGEDALKRAIKKGNSGEFAVSSCSKALLKRSKNAPPSKRAYLIISAKPERKAR